METRRTSLLLLGLIYLGFVSLGLPDGTTGVAWPQAHQELGVPVGLAGTILVVVTLLAAISGFSSNHILERFRIGVVVSVSCILTGTALLLLGFAQNLAWLLVAAVPLGLGAGAVDASLNGYVARHYTGRHMNWLHACWGIGATCGPLIMAEAVSEATGWRRGYFILGSAQLTLALVFIATLTWWNKVPESIGSTDTHAGDVRVPSWSANSWPGWLSALIFAVYVAVETTFGLWVSSILVLSRGFTPELAGLCTAGYYASITAGRIGVGAVVDRFGNRRLIYTGLLMATAGTVLFAQFAHGPATAAIALALAGLGFAPVYPCMMHEVPKRFAPGAVQTVIGRQSGAAYVGGAVLPAAAGLLAQSSLPAIAWLTVAGILVVAGAVYHLNRLT